ncbi:MAG: hypothetical protein QOK25_1907 [Thermoleophilaceae bacterium]|nr:hypothetical protein [Thermoleophilaceae bacterium]
MTRVKRPLRSLRIPLAALAVSVAALAAPAAGQANVTVFGSDLSKPANLVEDHGADAAFWNLAIDGDPGRAVVPADGQITVASVKGTVLADPTGRAKPDPQFHFQVLHPIGGGSVRVDLSSGAFRVPVGGNPQAVSSFRPVNLCVHRGDYVDFNDIGGFEWRWGAYGGMPFQVFSRTPASTTAFYTSSNGTNAGSQFGNTPHQGEELLMQTTLATGPDATDICPGGYAQHVFTGLRVEPAGQVAKLRTKTRLARIKTLCPGPSYGGCKGVLSADATFGNTNVYVGAASFNIRAGYPAGIDIKVTPAALKLAQKARSLAVNVNVQSHDDPAHDSRAKPGIPMQSRVTTANIRIQPDRLTTAKRKKKHH